MSLSMQEFRKLVAEFVLGRKLLDIKPANLYDDARWWENEGVVKVSPYIQPVSLWDTVTRTHPQVFDQEAIKVKPVRVDVERNYNLGAIGVIDVDAGEYWKILGIWLEYQCDGTVANRIMAITANPLPSLLPTIPGGMDMLLTTAITLTADQFGGIFMTPGPNHWTNVNGVVAIQADENPIPFHLTPGSQISYNCPAGVAGDEQCLTVWYQNVE